MRQGRDGEGAACGAAVAEIQAGAVPTGGEDAKGPPMGRATVKVTLASAAPRTRPIDLGSRSASLRTYQS